MKKYLSDVLLIAGLGCLTYAAFLCSIVAGLVTLGLSLIALWWLLTLGGDAH